MKRSILFLITALCYQVAFAASIGSLDKHQNALYKCFKEKNGKNSCISGFIAPYVPPGQDKLASIAHQLDDMFEKWIATDSVYEVYPIKTRTVGEIIVSKDYIVEDTGANLMMFQITYRKILGNWHIHHFNLTSQSDELKQALGL